MANVLSNDSSSPWSHTFVCHHFQAFWLLKSRRSYRSHTHTFYTIDRIMTSLFRNLTNFIHWVVIHIVNCIGQMLKKNHLLLDGNFLFHFGPCFGNKLFNGSNYSLLLNFVLFGRNVLQPRFKLCIFILEC